MAGLIEKIPDIITNIAAGGTTGTVLKLVLTFTLIIAGLWLKAWIQKQKELAAAKETQTTKIKDQTEVVGENKKLNDDAKKAEDEVRDIFKK